MSGAGPGGCAAPWGSACRLFVRSVAIRLSSSLTRRIVVLNLGGLVALLLLFLYINQFREGLIDARVQSLQTQGEIIAAAISASATVATDAITVDPEKLLQLAPGQSAAAQEEDSSALEFSINPERVGPVLRRLVSPTRTRARIYDKEGDMLLDSRALSLRGSIQRSDLPPPADAADRTLIERTWSEVKRRFGRTEVPLTDDRQSSVNGKYPEVARALAGATQSIVRVNAKGETIVSVAVPIQYFRTVRGALLLSTQGGDIDKIIASERWAILRVFLVAAVVMFVLSLFLAGTIAGPMRRLAEAAERVRRGVNSREEIPDFTSRADEIGHLSQRAAGHDPDALFAHGGDRKLRGRRGPRAQESAHLAAQRGRNAAAHPVGGIARAPDVDHPARHPPPRPADQRHFGRLAPRRRTGPRQDRGDGCRGPAAGGRLGRQRGRNATMASRSSSPWSRSNRTARPRRAATWSTATIRASVRFSPT